jgi:hypothetical protein
VQLTDCAIVVVIDDHDSGAVDAVSDKTAKPFRLTQTRYL